MQEEHKIEEVVDTIKTHINTRYELVVLKASDKLSGIVAVIIASSLIVLISILSFILLSFAAAYYISVLRNDTYSGFVIVGGAYLAIGLLLVLCRKKLLITPVRNKLIREFFKED